MKCIICGKETNGRYCKDCLEKEYPLIISFKKLKLKFCSSCKSLQYKNKWIPNHKKEKDKIIERYITDSVKFNQNYTNTKIEIVDYSEERKGLIIQIKASGTFKDMRYDKEIITFFELNIPLEETMCNKCRKADTQYYEAILQLREIPKQIMEKILNNLHSKMIEKKVVSNKAINLKLKNGENKDIYLSSMNFTKKFAKDLKKEYGGDLKITRKIFTKSKLTSKDVYRLTVLYRYKQK